MDIKLKNNRGQVITLIALALIMLLFVSYGVYTTFPDNSGIQKRVKTVDNHLFSMKKDLERDLYVSGFRTIFLAQVEIANSGAYISDFESFFNESIYNGTVSGAPKEIMVGATVNDIIDSMDQTASELSLNLKLLFSENDLILDNQELVFVWLSIRLHGSQTLTLLKQNEEYLLTSPL